jgi:hypothetical protein
MDLILKRKSYNSWGIIGELTDTDGETLFATLEHAFQQADGSFAPKLNEGNHDCVLGIHHLHKSGTVNTYEIKGVPGHTGILFHVGNYNKDSDGCVLLGTAHSGQMITGSKTAFSKFLKMQDDQSFNLEVIA